jgi:hypothetical protein
VPTVKIIGPYRFHFYTADQPEPRHIHVVRDDATAKFWLDPIRLSGSRDFSRVELNRIGKLIAEHQAEFRRKWDEYFHKH